MKKESYPDLTYELQRAQIELIQMRIALAEIRSSTLWHVTAPVRWLGRKMPGAARFCRGVLRFAGVTIVRQIQTYFCSLFGNASNIEPGKEGITATSVAVLRRWGITSDKNSHATTSLRFHTAPAPDISIIIPAYKHYDNTIACLTSIAQHSGTTFTYEVIVADDGVDDPVAPRLPAIPGLTAYVNERNLGFLHNCRSAALRTRGRHLLFLNDDTVVGPNWLEPMVRLAESTPAAGMIGCKLLNVDDTIQDAGWVIFSDGWGYPLGRNKPAADGEYNYIREVDCVTGACFLVPKKLYDEIGGFDPRFAPAFYEEFDLAFSLRQRGYKILYQPASEVMHRGSASYGAETRDHLSGINQAKFARKWEKELRQRPSLRAFSR